MLCYKGRYLAHVYYEAEDNGIIRIPNVQGIAHLLLEGYRQWALRSGIKELFIIQPIGPMLFIAKKYEFGEDYRFPTEKKPNVKVPKFNFITL